MTGKLESWAIKETAAAWWITELKEARMIGADMTREKLTENESWNPISYIKFGLLKIITMKAAEMASRGVSLKWK